MAPAPQAQVQGRKAGAVNYTREETLHLLQALKTILPIGPDEWNEVLSLHSVVYPSRDRISISRKYNILHRKSIPTGDPHCPPEVRLANNIKYLIGAKANIGDVEEHYDLANGYDSNDSDIPPAQLAAPPPRQLDPSPTKRSYSTRSSSQDVLGAFELSITQQREARDQDREEQREARLHDRAERKETMDAIGKIMCTMASTVASTFAPALAPRQNKRRRHRADSDDSDSKDDSY